MSLLESDAAMLAAKRASPAELAELKSLHGELETAAAPGAQDRERFFRINEQFHMRLLEVAGNRWCIQMVTDLRKIMKLNRHNSLQKAGRIDDSLHEHRAIMEALESRDGVRTRSRMQKHFSNGLQAAA